MVHGGAQERSMALAFDPVDFMARLAGLVPKPSVNFTRYHGVWAP